MTEKFIYYVTMILVTAHSARSLMKVKQKVTTEEFY